MCAETTDTPEYKTTLNLPKTDFPRGGGVSIIYKMLRSYTPCDNETPGKLFRFRNPVTGVALIIYLIRVICEMPELYEMLNALIHHGARDA